MPQICCQLVPYTCVYKLIRIPLKCIMGHVFQVLYKLFFFLTKGAKVILNPESNIWRYQNIHDYLTHEPYTSGQPKGILKDQESH